MPFNFCLDFILQIMKAKILLPLIAFFQLISKRILNDPLHNSVSPINISLKNPAAINN